MKLVRTSERLEIRHFPFVKWFIEIVCLAAVIVLSVWMFRSFTVSTGDGEGWIYLIGIGVVITAAVYVTVAGSGVFSPVISVIVDSTGKYVEICKWRVSGKFADRYYFYQLDRFRSYRTQRLGRTQYFLELKLPVGGNRLSIPIGNDKNTVTRLIKELNKLIRGT